MRARLNAGAKCFASMRSNGGALNGVRQVPSSGLPTWRFVVVRLPAVFAMGDGSLLSFGDAIVSVLPEKWEPVMAEPCRSRSPIRSTQDKETRAKAKGRLGDRPFVVRDRKCKCSMGSCPSGPRDAWAGGRVSITYGDRAGSTLTRLIELWGASKVVLRRHSDGSVIFPRQCASAASLSKTQRREMIREGNGPVHGDSARRGWGADVRRLVGMDRANWCGIIFDLPMRP